MVSTDGRDKRISELERLVAMQQVMIEAMRTGIGEAKAAAQQAARSIDSLKSWMLGTAALVAAQLLYLVLGGRS